MNELTNTVGEIEKINESYKNLIGKYRKQLNEMAIFTTNIVNVNDMLLNEKLDLSYEDKKAIVSEFKGVKTIEESDAKLKSLLKEYSENKKSITESIEEKFQSTTIEPSTSEEITKALDNNQINEQVERIKQLGTYKPVSK